MQGEGLLAVVPHVAGLRVLGLGAAALALTVELSRGSVWDREHALDAEAVDAALPEEAAVQAGR